MRLAILIPTLTERIGLLERVTNELNRQINQLANPLDVVIFLNEDQKQKTTGQKRNELIDDAIRAGAEYIAFVDDDDQVGARYIELNMAGILSGADCNSLWGQIYWDGKPGKPFHHSLKHEKWWEDDKCYYRCNNHLNCIKLQLVKEFRFPDQSFGEDGQWSMAIKEAGVLKTEFEIKETIYHYFNGQPKHRVEAGSGS